ncbi:zinc-binding dehydrogenase [Corynebacterium caspium]|uniref:zinc-binding dehydrogenase n=1 Tax=Corynebacterium caspium TaxID=234828 RepID=UPI00037B52E5|nr:zinc-binding dehydrogenase [Corynebacterium caspium]WKD59866.1 NADP-dependent isopropanol dehydrogenase [Corynebacterium caspium DSM 44850]
MKATFMHGPYDVRVAEVPPARILEPTDAVIQVRAACVCGSDLWRYRGIAKHTKPRRMGHEYIGVISELGPAVSGLAVGDLVVGSFIASDNTCPICVAGYQSKCVQAQGVGEAQAEYLRIPLASGTLVPVPGTPTPAQERSLLAASDVLGTGWFAAECAHAGPGKTTVVVGDGAVGLMAVLAAKYRGAERIIIMSRNPERQKLARYFGATDIVSARGAEGIAAIMELTAGLGAPSVIEAVGTQQAFDQARALTRPGGYLGFVGMGYEASIGGLDLFMSNIHLSGGAAPVRRYLPELIALIMDNQIDPGRVFDAEVPLAEVARGYELMDTRAAVKVLVRP